MKKLSREKKQVIKGLIPKAQREADAYAAAHGKGTWSAAYHRAMDRLAKEWGVRV